MIALNELIEGFCCQLRACNLQQLIDRRTPIKARHTCSSQRKKLRSKEKSLCCFFSFHLWLPTNQTLALWWAARSLSLTIVASCSQLLLFRVVSSSKWNQATRSLKTALQHRMGHPHPNRKPHKQPYLRKTTQSLQANLIPAKNQTNLHKNTKVSALNPT